MDGVIFNFFNKPERRLTEPAKRIKHERDKFGAKVVGIGAVFVFFVFFSCWHLSSKAFSAYRVANHMQVGLRYLLRRMRKFLSVSVTYYNLSIP